MSTYKVVVHVEKLDDEGNYRETIVPEHSPAVFDTIEEAETYCDDLMVGD